MAAHPGDTIHIPSGEPHTYRNTGETMASSLVILQPSGYETFFDELGMAADGATEPEPLTGSPDVARIMEVTGRRGVEMLG